MVDAVFQHACQPEQVVYQKIVPCLIGKLKGDIFTLFTGKKGGITIDLLLCPVDCYSTKQGYQPECQPQNLYP